MKLTLVVQVTLLDLTERSSVGQWFHVFQLSVLQFVYITSHIECNALHRTHTHTHKYVRTHIYTLAHTDAHKRMHAHNRVHAHNRMHAHKSAHAHKHTLACQTEVCQINAHLSYVLICICVLCICLNQSVQKLL